MKSYLWGADEQTNFIADTYGLQLAGPRKGKPTITEPLIGESMFEWLPQYNKLYYEKRVQFLNKNRNWVLLDRRIDSLCGCLHKECRVVYKLIEK